MRKALYILKNKEDAQDVVQDAFTKIYLNAGRFQVQEGASLNTVAWETGHLLLLSLLALLLAWRGLNKGRKLAT